MTILVISGGHILILVVAMLLLFGGKKIPELMGGIGKGMKDFKKAIKDDDAISEEPLKETPKAIINKKEAPKE
jgi:sec-independent protein translocase protein TatA